MMRNKRFSAAPGPATLRASRKGCGGLLNASLLLPGLAALALSGPAQSEEAPQKTTVAVKYGSYQDGQANWDRVKVRAPMVYVQAPVASDWAVEGSWVGDSVSGASPRWHTQQSSASHMSDYRKAADLKLTRYFSRAAVSASLTYSDEHDYTSRALGLDARWSSEDNNRTWAVGYGYASDRIDNTSNGVNTAIDQHKRTHELMAGVTQVLSPKDIVQFNLTRSMGKGYYNDPYKQFDQRPDHRNAWIALARWNHYLADSASAIRGSYRYYNDSFGVVAHTLALEWVKPLGRWTLTPGLRYYSQSAAHFYFDPVLNPDGSYNLMATLARGTSINGDKSADQRLAAFGALTASIKIAYAIDANTSIDLKLERYRQDSAWRLGGGGSPGLDAFNAHFIQVGFTHRF